MPNDAARAARRSSATRSTSATRGRSRVPGGASVNGGYLFAVNATTGDAIWTTQVDAHPRAILTVGRARRERRGLPGRRVERGGARPPIRATRAARSAAASSPWTRRRARCSGRRTWCRRQRPCANPARCGYSGAASGGRRRRSTRRRNTLYVDDRQQLHRPDVGQGLPGRTAARPSQCLDPNDHVDAIVALDATTGQIKWATGSRASTTGTSPASRLRPGELPARTRGRTSTSARARTCSRSRTGRNAKLAVGAGQKSGIYWALDAATGQILWRNAAGPGLDARRHRVGAGDGRQAHLRRRGELHGIPYALPGGGTITSGSWAALDPATGKILWQVADPSTTSSAAATRSARSRSRTASSTRPR